MGRQIQLGAAVHAKPCTRGAFSAMAIEGMPDISAMPPETPGYLITATSGAISWMPAKRFEAAHVVWATPAA